MTVTSMTVVVGAEGAARIHQSLVHGHLDWIAVSYC